MNLNHQYSKSHFKMYKAGKFWLVSGISLFTLGISSSAGLASADTSLNETGISDTLNPANFKQSETESPVLATTTTVSQTSSSQTSLSTNSQSDNGLETEVVVESTSSDSNTPTSLGTDTKDLTNQSVSEDSTVNDSQTDKSTNSEINSQVDVQSQTDGTVQVNQSESITPIVNGSEPNPDSSTTTAAAGQGIAVSQEASETTAAADFSLATSITNSTVASQETSQSLLAHDLSLATSAAHSTALSQADSLQSQDLPMPLPVSADSTLSVFDSGNLVGQNLSNDQVVAYILAQDKHLKFDQGKFYFIGDDGQVQKNFTAIIDNQVMYFGKDTGQLQSLRNQYTDGLTNITNAHNAAVDLTPASFQTTDGFMTADSWYRPKDILKDGTTWTPSGTNDFRPLLMSWWPDKNTQIAYLAFAKTKGWLPSDTNLTDTNQNNLTQLSELAQQGIEKEISAKNGQTDWLHQDMSDFVKSQPGWNIQSEQPNNEDLQGGTLLYVNSKLTPASNSDYRLINRNTINQDGSQPSQGGAEFLLGNDIDNSNPVVQAEQLNWLYYLMNIGSIVANDPSGNFDGYRVDAVDNVNSDLLNIAAQYFKQAYGVDKGDAQANQHLSILEDWGFQDPDYVKQHGNQQLTMDFRNNLSLRETLTFQANQRRDLSSYLNNGLVNRTGDKYQENVEQPNYNFIRAHDSLVQEVIAKIIREKVNPNVNGLTNASLNDIEKALQIYKADQVKAEKEYNPYNLPAAYALLLTNKDTVPRVYYGDLFSDDGQYMAHKTIYYDAISNLLRSRVKYVAGGQNMGVQTVKGASTMTSGTSKEILTSVRYGKGADTQESEGNEETRTQGIGVIISNNPDLQLADEDRVTLKMGLAHKNQAYRAVLQTTANGLQSYSSDNAPVIWTDDNGVLTFDKNTIFGIHDPQVSGYLAVWVPVGAADNQDARTAGSEVAHQDNSVYHSNAALDSQLIFEGFSNFQAMPTSEEEYTNVKIAQNAPLFKALGITSFEFAPQYRSSTDDSFLDSVVRNGYAFTDRYDIGYNTPTKYGTASQLVAALKALHQEGITAINDWVPDQIYDLPGQQIVAAQRVDAYGNPIQDSDIDHTLYASHTVGGGEYQKKFGGVFLDLLKERYPSLFTEKQISTGQPMNPNEKITEWSAKYFNGTNIQGRGAFYVLKDPSTQQYFIVDQNGAFLPKQVLGENANTGFIEVNGKISYFSTSGYQAKDSFILDGDNWYYFDRDGYMVFGDQTIDGLQCYFLPNGVQLRNSSLYRNGVIDKYDALGHLEKSNYPDSSSQSTSMTGSTPTSGSTPGSTSTSSSTSIAPGSTSTSSSTSIAPGSTSTSSSTSVAPGSTSTSSSTSIAPGSTSTSSSTSIAPSASISRPTSRTHSKLPITHQHTQNEDGIIGLLAINTLLFFGIKRNRRL